jgi:hypothetical protein
MENYRKQEIGSNNSQNNIKSLNFNNTITNNPQEIANTFNDYFLTVADIVIGKIKKDNEPGENLNPSNYLIYHFKSTFPRIIWNYATTYEIDNIIKSLKTKNSYGYDEIPIKILKYSTPARCKRPASHGRGVRNEPSKVMLPAARLFPAHNTKVYSSS